MRSAERRQEVIERVLIRNIDKVHLQAPLVTVSTEQIVVTKRQVEQVSWRDALWVVVVILRIWRRDRHQVRAIQPHGAQRRQWHVWIRFHGPAEQTCLKFLICAQTA